MAIKAPGEVYFIYRVENAQDVINVSDACKRAVWLLFPDAECTQPPVVETRARPGSSMGHILGVGCVVEFKSKAARKRAGFIKWRGEPRYFIPNAELPTSYVQNYSAWTRDELIDGINSLLPDWRTKWK